jgi:glycosyltransferase involved in cell wall biosynthesis
MLISIISINYNDVAGLERTIKSVQEQSATNYEHILIDGGSTDGSAALIEQYQDNFSYWVSEPERGIYDAIKKLNYYRPIKKIILPNRILKILKF